MKKHGCLEVFFYLIIAAFVIAVAVFSYNIMSEGNNTEDSYEIKDTVTEYQYEYQPPEYLTEDEIYDILCTQLGAFKTEIDLGGSAKKTELAAAAGRVRADHPEYFWTNAFKWQTFGSDTVITYYMSDDYEASDIPEMYSKLEKAADDIAAEIPDDISDYEKTVLAHDVIIDLTEYDTDGRDSGTFGLWSTAYGCLLDGKAVCSGYACAFKMIMDRKGIECGMVSGTGKNENHAWNYVLLDGQYYWIDLTWDDPVSQEGESQILHDYCLIDDRFLKDHTPDEDENYFIPECSSMDNNYFVKNGTYAESYSFEQINEMILSCEEKEYAEILFSSAQVGEECLEDLLENKMIWETDSFREKRSSINYSYDEETLVLKIKMQY